MDYRPAGFHTITPFIMAKNPDAILNFVKSAFDAREVLVLRDEKGTITHAQIQIGDSPFMMGDSMGKEVLPAMLYLYVPECDAMYYKALGAGGTTVQVPGDQFYGDRNAGVKDPEGNIWWIATYIESLSADEIRERARAHDMSA